MIQRRSMPLSVRELAESETGAEFTGIAVPYGVPTSIPSLGIRETFAPGSIEPESVIGLPLLWRHEEPIGSIREARNLEDGLEISAEILPTNLGRDAVTLIRGGAVSGLSIGFVWAEDSLEFSEDRSEVTHHAADIREVSVTPTPAHLGARITATREDHGMTATPVGADAPPAPTAPDLATREDLAALEARILAGSSSTDAPLSEREFWVTYRAALTGSTEAQTSLRALADSTLAADGGLSPIPSLTRVRNALTRGRPTAEAFGIEALPGYGLSVDIPTITQDPSTGNQASEKAEVTSTALVVDFTNSPVFTEAGATDVSYQLIQRSSPEAMPLLMARFVEVYARRFNARVLAVAGTTATTVPIAAYTPEGVGEALAAAAAAIVGEVYSAPAFVTAAPDVFYGMALASGNGYPLAGGNIGNANLSSPGFTVAGLNVILDPGIAAGTAYVSVNNGEAITVLESPGAPFTVEAEVPAKLGRDVAVYGYGSIAAMNIGAVVALTAPAGP